MDGNGSKSERFPVPHMKNIIFLLTLLSLFAAKCLGQINRPPEFLRGGDMDKFSIREDTPVGASVYTLKARDPENTRVHYYISGDSFTVEKDTGIVRLIRPLDRETENTVDVIISITDDKVQGQNPNTISIKREITVLDQNDNAPVFQNVPYAFLIDETTPIGSTVYQGIFVSDSDIGINAEVEMSCLKEVTPLACEKFDIKSYSIGDGRFQGEVILKGSVDYEQRSAYTMSVMAEDLALTNRLNSTANVVIEVKDIQDQPPVFQNSPYTATVMENSAPGTSVLSISVRDGDTGDPRPIVLMIQEDENKYFQLGQKVNAGGGITTTILETANPVDRENNAILDNGGLYTFQIKAIEIVDGEPVGDSVVTNITIVVGDMNDQEPVFNQHEFNITIPEDIGENTPLPGLNIVVADMDVGDNAKFSLFLEDVQNSEGVFTVFPSTAVGRTPVIIRVADATKLDYELPDKRIFIFNIKASQGGHSESSAKVTVTLSDANDNAPVFEHDQYTLQIPENTPPGSVVFTLQAYDADTGIFGQITYSLKGFGSDKITVEPETGEIKIADCGKPSCLDYEAQQGYSLTYEAQDGGGKVTSVNLFVEVLDVNDNAPQFVRDVYSHEIQENSQKILPPLFVRATDADGPTQGGGAVSYSIVSSELHDFGAITIDPESGEVLLQRPIKFSETPNRSGLISVVIQAIDGGNPPLASKAKLMLKVKKENDGAPEFVGEPYEATVKENSVGGTSVLKIVASDPDGPDSNITYYIHSGAKDNFVINKHSGLISVASGANLDRDIYGSQYKVVVQALDSGIPAQKTATTTVMIFVEDVNNKQPIFPEESYVHYISESLGVGEEVITITASDPDKDSKIRYSLVEPIIARDKTGAVVTSSSAYNYKAVFRINATTGRITVNKPLDYNSASVVILTVQAIDLNAVEAAAGGIQKSSVEVTIYIRAQSEMNPVFSPPWTTSNPTIEITVPEEASVGSTLLTLSARDPLTHRPVTQFEKIPGSDPDNYVSVSPVSGVVALNRRLDFEELPLKHISFKVKAIFGEAKNLRSSEATVTVNVQDINDNSPVFVENSYKTSIPETAVYPQSLLTVLASDKDSQEGFGIVEYSVSGDGSNMFDIDGKTGTIFVREGAVLDRETQEIYNLQVMATDNPNGEANQRRTSVLVIIKVLDANDNAPKFNQEIYTAVVPENVPIDFSVITVKAVDADAGKNGEVQYLILDDSEKQSINFFAVNSQTGVVSVIRPLSGKGRTEPYKIRIQAMDKGSPPLHSDCHLLVVVGDVSTNDGVPQFIRPAAGEVAYVHENVTVGTPVFQVVAFDPDNPNTANGKVAYKLLDDQSSTDHEYEFSIDAVTGIISTRAPLDRERKENYTMIVVAHDFGFPPQEAHRVLRVFVMDVDDSDPMFTRPVNSQPIELYLKEEVPIGTVAGKVKAVDNDTGENAVIDYYIIDGNSDDVFGIRRTSDNEGEIIVQKRVDRESVPRYILTIKAGKPSIPLSEQTENYDSHDLSEIQVAIILEDIDDNPPTFETSSYVLGAKTSTEIDTELVTLQAADPDISSGLVTYSIKNMTFVRPSTQEAVPVTETFHINPKTGVLHSNQRLGRYVGGFFDIAVEAKSSPGIRNIAIATVKIYILQEQDLLKFVFYKRPSEVREIIPQLKKDIKLALAQPISLNVYDTQFYARNDGSLDFESTSSCFQLLENDVIIDPKTVIKILNKEKSTSVKNLYQNYSIVSIENCVPGREPYKMSWSEIMVLIIAALIAVSAFVVSIVLCVLYSRYRRKLKRSSYFHNVYMAENGGHPSILSPAEQQRIYEWQEMNAPLADAASFRSYPTLR